MKFDPIVNPGLSGPGMAHDIHGLMSCAMLAAEQLNYHDDPRVVRQATRIIDAVERAVAVCKTELARDSARRLETEQHETQCVERLFRQISNLIGLESSETRRRVDFRSVVSQAVQVECNSSALFRILFNLINNAATAITQKGGTYVEVSVMQIGDRVIFDITDDGPGLPDNVLEFLFPNLDVRSERKGRIGRGLSTAASLAADMGGELQLNETSKLGTSFRLTIPSHIDVSTSSRIVRTFPNRRDIDVTDAVVVRDVIRPLARETDAMDKSLADA